MEQKKQTARVSELEEMAEVKDTDQKTTDHSVKEEVEEGPSKDLQQETMSPSCQKQEEKPSTSNVLPLKKQTARDNESGETSQASDNVQKTTDHSVKEEVEEGPSKDLQQEAEEKKHSFRFCLNSETFSVACKTSMTVLEALNTSKKFRNEKNKKNNTEKEILIQRPKGEFPRAAVKTDFPCCLIEKDEILDISFIKKDENGSTNPTTADPSLLSKRSKPEELVTFWVKKEGGPRVKYLLKSEVLRKSVHYVCVYAFKGETVETALKQDGRFNDVIFEKYCGLSEFSLDTKHEFSIPVENLDRKAFQVVVISDNLRDSQDAETLVKTEPNAASGAEAAENAGPSQNPIILEQENKQNGNTTNSLNPSTKLYVAKRIDKSEEILGILRSQFKGLLETLKQRENLKNKSQVQSFFRAEFDKSVQSFLEVKKVKELMKLSEHVCQIRVEGSARGTGFLLFDRFILTNAHVIGEFDPFSRKLSKTFTAVFGYEDLQANETKCVPIEEQVVANYHGKSNMGRYLDFALLELKATDEIANCPGLLSRYIHGPPPNRGKICIVGHPGEGVKKMDPCFIIERENLQEAVDKHISENVSFIHVITQQSLVDKWEVHDNQINYDSCFFHGSSGSPVFDEDCYLIGMHTGGFVYKGAKDQTRSVVEYSYSMQPILESIITQAKERGRSDVLKLLSEYKSLNLILENNDVDMEVDS